MTDSSTDLEVTGGAPVRVRFCPSPTGNPHVGVVRTALFNWAFARHYGGTFVFRIEDTDSSRDSEESYEQMLGVMRWLGLDWDEGPEVGGPFGPYRQSQRLDLYADVARRLLEAGLAYESFSTPDEVERRRIDAGQDPKLGYDNRDRDLTPEERVEFRAQGRLPVLRLVMPAEDLTFHDFVRGDVHFAAGSVPDFVLVRGNGDPLYTLTNPLDDALMGITHVLRGEDLLSSTPRQVALFQALGKIGIGSGEAPKYAHLPLVMGEGNRKLSKRDPQSSIEFYRTAGYIPAGLLNYLALLGWSLTDDRDVFSMQEMQDAFDVRRVNSAPARFDEKKAIAINAAHIRAMSPEDFAPMLGFYLGAAGLIAHPPTDDERAMVTAVAPLVQQRMNVLGEAPDMVRFLFLRDGVFAVEESSVAMLSTPESQQVVVAAHEALQGVSSWDAESIEAALRVALIDGLGLKPKHAFGPVRVAVTGRRVSPPLFESMHLLGRDHSLLRLEAATHLH